ncbi:ABC transporter substrate-binding protein [Roseinatronobacter sp. S2]|uniref:ABC transporter substrate-binding protein n=1 Tax=Roseinatronobacter sp. S2 TaxID=3035471 RepID=UPI00240FDDF7|nr:ABC transporter substrate-binding protein [Roseinatronobacter sp. S2]WFE73363.1 ABC transporter substrate-binding protein [Roseinatronobacter sp. S2]
MNGNYSDNKAAIKQPHVFCTEGIFYFMEEEVVEYFGREYGIKLSGGVRRHVSSTSLAAIIAVLPASAFADAHAGMNFQQAPELDEAVNDGQLPPVAERLPANPLVITPRDEIGQYGGAFRSLLIGAGDSGWMYRTIGYDGLIEYDVDWSGFEPAAAESFEVSDDATTYTFNLREGMKWSDGEPVTTADVEYWYEHELLNETLYPVVPGFMQTSAGVAELEIIDETTFRFIFEEPKGLFLDELARIAWMPTARHYGEQFHADFNEEANAVAVGEGFDDWASYYNAMIPGVDDEPMWRNPDLPTIRAWTPVEGYAYTGRTPQVRFERNPYYYKVDTEGNQLPYADGWTFAITEDPEVMLFQTMRGDVDLIQERVATPQNRPLLFDEQERGNFRMIPLQQANATAMVIAMNMTHDDPVTREALENRDFRIGMSHAMNREEINQIVYAGQSEPRQMAPHPENSFYHERLESQYLEYDLDLAFEHFEKAGLTQDDQGRWIGSDGQQVALYFDASNHDPERLAIMELAIAHWNAAGIKVDARVVDRTLFVERILNGHHQIAMWSGSGGMRDALFDPRYYSPWADYSFAAPKWAVWNGRGAAGGMLERGVEAEEPPEAVKESYRLVEELHNSPPEMHDEIMTQILDIAADEFFSMGTVSHAPGYGIIHNRVGNQPPDGMTWSWALKTWGPAGMEQMFIRQ